jgi:hypothetical protein
MLLNNSPNKSPSVKPELDEESELLVVIRERLKEAPVITTSSALDEGGFEHKMNKQLF